MEKGLIEGCVADGVEGCVAGCAPFGRTLNGCMITGMSRSLSRPESTGPSPTWPQVFW